MISKAWFMLSLVSFFTLDATALPGQLGSTPVDLPVDVRGVHDIATGPGAIYLNLREGAGEIDSGPFFLLEPQSGNVALLTDVTGGIVEACVADGAGGWFVGGRFDTGDDTRVLTHLLPNGDIDPAFDFPMPVAATDKVRSLYLSGDTLYLCGDFGFESQTGNRSGVAAVQADTGAFTEWSPVVEGPVDELSGFGNKLYLLGEFTKVNSQARNGLCSFDLASGALTSWDPSDRPPVVNAVLPTSIAVYLAGGTGADAGPVRETIVAVDAVEGQPVDFRYSLSGDVVVLAAKGDALVAGFTNSCINYCSQYYVEIDPATGEQTKYVFQTQGNPEPSVLVSGPNVYAGANGMDAYPPRPIMPGQYLATPMGKVHALAAQEGVIAVGGDFSAVHMETGMVTLDPESLQPIPSPLPSGVRLIDGADAFSAYYSCSTWCGTSLVCSDRDTGQKRWNADTAAGVLDVAATPAHLYVVEENTFHTFDRSNGAGLASPFQFNGRIKEIENRDGTLYIAGTFTTFNGVSRNGFASVDAATGELNDWDPGLGRGRAVRFLGDGIYAGRVATANQPEWPLLARLGGNAATFPGPITGLGSWNTRNVCNDVSPCIETYFEPPYVCEVVPFQGSIVAGGYFDRAGGASHQNVAQLLPGAEVSGWSPEIGRVSSMAVGGDRVLIVDEWGLKVYGPAPEFSAPSRIWAASVAANTVSLAWGDNSSAELGFNLYSSLDGFTSPLSVAPPDVSALRHEGLTPNTRYQYRVTAFDAERESGPTEVLAVVTEAMPPTLGENLTCDRNLTLPYPVGTTFTFSNPIGFGTGEHGGSIYRASYFNYIWSKSSAAEPNSKWDNGTLALKATSPGIWCLRIAAANEERVWSEVVTLFVSIWDIPSEGAEEGAAEGGTTEGAAGGEAETADGSHSADTNHDGQMALSEMLRVVQLFTAKVYSCAGEVNTEDGYIPVSTEDHTCSPHDSDYDPQDWRISLSELMRLVQLYNNGSYTPCEGAEDGFCLN